MKNKYLFILLFSTMVFVFIASLFNTMNVSAEDEVPPIATTEPVVTEEPVAIEEPLPSQEPVATVEPVATEESATDILPIFEQLPEDTVVVVYEENGNVLPLASQAAADALVEPDPQFCPAGLPPLDPGCSPVRGTIAQAVADAYAAGGDGTIYVEAGTFNENVTINGSLFTGPVPTILNVVGAGSGLSIVNGSIQILNMNTFTLSGFTVNDYVQAQDNSGTMNLTDIVAGASGGVSDGSAIISIYNQNGDILLTDVTANNGTASGALLDNAGGTGDIIVTNGTFNTNGIYGLLSYSAGDITINDSNASGNLSADGFYLDSFSGTGDISVTNSTAAGNGNQGFNVGAGGSIILDSITAGSNAANGVIAGNANSLDTISMINSTLNGNAQFGFQSTTPSSITLNGVIANNNGSGGTFLDTTLGPGNVDVTNSTFDGNTGYGLQVITSGTTTMDGVTATNNTTIGVIIDAGSGTGDVTVSNSVFTDNTQFGLQITTNGDVLLDGVTVSNNINSDGAYINAQGNITITCSSFENNGDYGVNNANGSPMTFDSAVTLSANGSGPYNGSILIDSSSCGNTATPTATATFTNTNTPTATLTSTVTSTPTITLTNTVTSTPTITLPVTTPLATNVAGGNGRPLHMVPVSGDPLIDLPTPLDCVRYRGTRLILSNDDSVVFLCPLQSTARLDLLPINLQPGGLPVELPAELPQGDTFVSGFITHLIRNNNREQTILLARAALVSFTIPEDMLEANLVILFWDIEEESWVEVDPGIEIDDNRYDACVKTLMGRFDDEVKELFHREACVDYTGTFVLVSR